jgi:hypothetical protein
MPRWTRKAVAAFLVPGEPVMAGLPGVNVRYGAAACVGTSGAIPVGRVLLVSTDRRVLVFTGDKKFRPVDLVASFTGQQLSKATLSYGLGFERGAGDERLDIAFADGSMSRIRLPLPSLMDLRTFAKATIDAIAALRSAALPPPKPMTPF